MGDRYAREGIERSYACHLQDLLDGCFGEQGAEQLGPAVWAEVLAEVRYQLGITDAEVRASLEATSPEAGSAEARASEVAAEPTVSSETAATERSSETVSTERSSATSVQVVLTACPSIDLALVVALRAITRGSVADRLPRLQAPPHVVVADVPRPRGEAIAGRLRSLGATIELRPVAG